MDQVTTYFKHTNMLHDIDDRKPTMRSSNVLTMMPSGSDVASRAISFLTVLKNFFASAGWNSIFLNECVSKKRKGMSRWWLNSNTDTKKTDLTFTWIQMRFEAKTTHFNDATCSQSTRISSGLRFVLPLHYKSLFHIGSYNTVIR